MGERECVCMHALEFTANLPNSHLLQVKYVSDSHLWSFISIVYNKFPGGRYNLGSNLNSKQINMSYLSKSEMA